MVVLVGPSAFFEDPEHDGAASAAQARGAEQPRRGAARSLRQRPWEPELRVACGAAPMGRPPVARPDRGPGQARAVKR